MQIALEELGQDALSPDWHQATHVPFGTLSMMAVFVLDLCTSVPARQLSCGAEVVSAQHAEKRPVRKPEPKAFRQPSTGFAAA